MSQRFHTTWKCSASTDSMKREWVKEENDTDTWHQSIAHITFLSFLLLHISQLLTIYYLLFTAFCWGFCSACSECCKCGVVWAISHSKLLNIFPKSLFLLCIWVHDVQAFNVLTNQFPALKTTQWKMSKSIFSYHTLEPSWIRLLSVSLCVFMHKCVLWLKGYFKEF